MTTAHITEITTNDGVRYRFEHPIHGGYTRYKWQQGHWAYAGDFTPVQYVAELAVLEEAGAIVVRSLQETHHPCLVWR